MYYVGLFILTFVFIYMIYYLFTIRKELVKLDVKEGKRKSKKPIDEAKIPVEIHFLLLRYHLDMEKISYRKLLYLIAVIGSFDMAITVTVISFLDGFVWQLLFGFVILLILILISYELVGKYYKKKGMVKDVSI